MSNLTPTAQVNDEFRKSWNAYIVITPIVQSLGSHVSDLLQIVRQFYDFNEDNDPYEEHDFGAIDYNGEKYFWKIDYYDQNLKNLSPNPADPTQTRRVLTIMHSSEY
ncbi:MAG: DUF3768 domain-containing protein [Synechococcaceae cyanobacterium SM2_3_2]|nr:DUF3768 domain-containing protein [Synechococcaceae cyanobacterium SM2_3_2]